MEVVANYPISQVQGSKTFRSCIISSSHPAPGGVQDYREDGASLAAAAYGEDDNV